MWKRTKPSGPRNKERSVFNCLTRADYGWYLRFSSELVIGDKMALVGPRRLYNSFLWLTNNPLIASVSIWLMVSMQDSHYIHAFEIIVTIIHPCLFSTWNVTLPSCWYVLYIESHTTLLKQSRKKSVKLSQGLLYCFKLKWYFIYIVLPNILSNQYSHLFIIVDNWES